jgi:hypothetical protein
VATVERVVAADELDDDHHARQQLGRCRLRFGIEFEHLGFRQRFERFGGIVRQLGGRFEPIAGGID